MGIGTSLLLITVGAVLRFAVHVSTRGVSVHTVGLILMIVGIAGLLISILWMAIWLNRRDSAADGRVPRLRRLR